MGSRVSPNVGTGGRIMITDGGPHPPEFWAQVMAEEIMDLAQSGLTPWNIPDEPQTPVRNADPMRSSQALRLQAGLLEALTPHFDGCITAEREKLQEDMAHLLSELGAPEHAANSVKSVHQTLDGSLWHGHFAAEDAERFLYEYLHRNLRSAQHIERSWHVDRNPEHEHAKAWKAIHHSGPGA